MPNLKLWHSCSKRAIWRNVFPFETVFKQTSNNIRILIPEERNTLLPLTRYGLDGPGFKLRWGARYSKTVQTGPGAHPASYTKRTGTFPAVKQLKSGVDHPPRSNAQVKERVKLYISSPAVPTWKVIGWNLLSRSTSLTPDGVSNFISSLKYVLWFFRNTREKSLDLN